MSAVLPWYFWLNSLRNITKFVVTVYFQSQTLDCVLLSHCFLGSASLEALLI